MLHYIAYRAMFNNGIGIENNCHSDNHLTTTNYLTKYSCNI